MLITKMQEIWSCLNNQQIHWICTHLLNNVGDFPKHSYIFLFFSCHLFCSTIAPHLTSISLPLCCLRNSLAKTNPDLTTVSSVTEHSHHRSTWKTIRRFTVERDCTTASSVGQCSLRYTPSDPISAFTPERNRSSVSSVGKHSVTKRT